MNERTYQRDLVDRIQDRWPDCFIQKNDPARQQGVPDILILFRNTWAMLEIKLEPNSPQQPNQDYYIKKFDGMSFAAFINPDNEEEVLNDLQSTFRLAGKARVS